MRPLPGVSPGWTQGTGLAKWSHWDSGCSSKLMDCWRIQFLWFTVLKPCSLGGYRLETPSLPQFYSSWIAGRICLLWLQYWNPGFLVGIGWRPLTSSVLLPVPCPLYVVIHNVVFPFSRSAGEPLSFWISLRNGSDIILRAHLIRSGLEDNHFFNGTQSQLVSHQITPFP